MQCLQYSCRTLSIPYFMLIPSYFFFSFFFFNATATTEIYTLSLHDALPISGAQAFARMRGSLSTLRKQGLPLLSARTRQDRKSTRLNSSHITISYAVFCLKKKKKKKKKQKK